MTDKKPYMTPYTKHRLRRIKPLRLVLGFVIAIGVIYVIRGLGNDDDEFDYMSQKLEQLYAVDNQKIGAASYDDKKGAAGGKVGDAAGNALGTEQLRQYKKPKAASNSRFRTQSCANYVEYSQELHSPYSEGPLELPFQRPPEHCRTFASPAVEKVIDDLKERIKDPDLARLVENALPNTLDTTILWHKPKGDDLSSKYSQSFVVTGDIHAEWLRDAARQLSIYHNFTNQDEDLKELMRGAINTQASYIMMNPYCNAFHPPPGSGIKKGQTHFDKVSPRVNWKHVFECKWEIDSLASFLTLTNEYYTATNDHTIFNTLWFNAMSNILKVIHRQQSPTFDESGRVLPFYYTFQRDTNVGTETLPLAGTGNPVNYDIGLVRSAFRPSDDACTLQYFIPGNAHMATELLQISKNLLQVKDQISEPAGQFIDETQKLGTSIKQAILDHAIFDHKEFGKVFAFEIDGYGSATFMDDANIPSLLSLPDLGFIDKDDPVYQNTRNMILSNRGNPYFIQGKYFKGIGGPHIGIHNAWPMSLLLAIRTTDDDQEIKENLQTVLQNTAGLGLIHESIQVQYPGGFKFTRPWFAWANSEFGKTILDLAQRKPHLIFKDEYAKTPYIISSN